MESSPHPTIADGLTLCPVFCTTDIPTDLLNDLITTFKQDDVGNPEGDDCLRFLRPEDAAANIKSIQALHHAPMSPMAPFYNWSMKDIYDFWLTHVRPPLDRASTGWTSFTVLVLDANSTKDRKCGVCSNAPDLGEQGDGEILKSVRMSFAEAPPNMVSFEMMTIAPSESNKETTLNVVPPVGLDTRDTPPGEGLKGTLATPEYARASQRRGFLQAQAQGVV